MTVATSTIPESKIGNLKKSLQLSQIHPKFLRMVSKLPTVKGPLNTSLESALFAHHENMNLDNLNNCFLDGNYLFTESESALLHLRETCELSCEHHMKKLRIFIKCRHQQVD